MTTLRKIVEEVGDCYIEYNTEYEGEYVFAGACQYKNGELIPMDYDTYSLDDVIDRYGVAVDYRTGEKFVCVFYESEWLDESNLS